MLGDLDQLERFVTRAFDHHCARVAELVGLGEEGDALAAQLGDPGVEIGDAERDVIVHLAPAAHERLIALPHVPQERHIVDRGRRRSGPRSTLQVASVRGVELVRSANTGALKCFWYQSCAQSGSIGAGAGLPQSILTPGNKQASQTRRSVGEGTACLQRPGRVETRVQRVSGLAGTRSSGLARHTGFSWRTDGVCPQQNRTADDTHQKR